MLETQIVPLYYAKPDGRLPLAWIQLMRESIRTVVPVFNTHRMVKEYNERLYEPAAQAHADARRGRREKGGGALQMEGQDPQGLAADPHRREGRADQEQRPRA